MRFLIACTFLFVASCSAGSGSVPWCGLIETFSSVDLSGGAATTAQFPEANTRPGWEPTRYTYLMVAVDLTDANDGVSNVRATFTASDSDGGTFRGAPLCSNAAPALTCGNARLDWDPQTYGKNWWLKPIDWGYPYGKITLTPTGHGAGDEADLTVYGCWE